MAVTTTTPDRVILWPLWSGIVILTIANVLQLLPILGFFVTLILLFPLVVIGSGIIVWCAAVTLLRRQWRLGLSMMAFPLMIALTVPSAEMARSARYEVRFYIHKGRFDAEAATARAEGKHFAWLDDWSVFVTANEFVVWDEQDKPEEASGFKLHRRLGGHFYLVGD